MKHWSIAGVLLLANCAAQAQNFAPGATEIVAEVGILRINSGLVGNFNAHDFHVYSFQLKAGAAEEQWNQVPLAVAGQPDLEFIVTTAATADFFIRDATIRHEGESLVLTVAQLRFDETPYDDSAWVELRRYVLRRIDDENRWVFEQSEVNRAPQGTTVDGFIATDPKP